MDHQVEDDVDVETARREGSQALDLDESRIGARVQQGLDRRVVELHVSHGENPLPPVGRGDQGVGLRERRRDRLLDQQVQTAFEERQSELAVERGRRREHRCVDPSGELLEARCDARPVLGRHRRRHIAAGIEDAFQNHAIETRKEPGMVTPERADTEDSDSRRTRSASRHRSPPLRGGSAAP